MVDGHRFLRSISRYDDQHRTPRQNGVAAVALTAHRSARLAPLSDQGRRADLRIRSDANPFMAPATERRGDHTIPVSGVARLDRLLL
jgi:hypothetical protein